MKKNTCKKKKNKTKLELSENTTKLDFQDGYCGNHLGFQIGTVLAIFYLQVTKPSFKSTGILVKEKKFKLDFQDDGHGGHLRFPNRTI